jgi:hypothetical protein
MAGRSVSAAEILIAERRKKRWGLANLNKAGFNLLADLRRMILTFNRYQYHY